ncbi:ras-related protein Rab-28 [Plutella xylostella]|uniref:ras-related protein Rab-28 n=1 Tax=Plutella xylostella TaxID=51655 RepID=UPI0020326CBA|nr:ras-related protein Rab-28 [Plutella xylostella]
MSDTEEDEVQNKSVKITVVGEPSTGKSTLCARYLGAAAPGGGTAGAAVLAGQCLALRPPVPVQLCDVAGNSLGTGMLDNYLYASDIVLFVYDVTNLQSFDKLDSWLKKVKSVFEPEPRKPLLALFGNKSDLEHQRAVRLSVVQKFASEHLLENFKGSAKTGEMVSTALTSLVARLLGAKVKRAPGTTNGRSPQGASHSPPPLIHDDSSHSLIMNRKALRRVQRKAKASSSVCAVQ